MEVMDHDSHGMEVMDHDSHNDLLKTNQEPKGIFLDKLIKCINDLGIPFSVWEKVNADGRGSGMYDWSSLVGSDKKKLLYKLPEQRENDDILFPETKSNVVKFWIHLQINKYVHCRN